MFAGWKNPFSTKSILEFADSFVALQADVIIPHILPGATSTGRPYIVDNATYLANLTSVQFTRASLPNLSSPQNVTYPAVLSGLSHAAPAGRVIDAAAWYGYLAGFVASVLLFVILAWSNRSIRTTNKALSVAASQTDRLFSGLLELTSRSDPEMSAHLREFLRAAQQQGWIPDPYKLDLMAHVELIIGLDGQVTLLTFRNDELSKKYDARLDDILNLQQALALYQDRYEKRDREAIHLNMTVERLNTTLSSQSQSHLGKVDQLAKEYNVTETTNTEQLSERHLERIKNLEGDHKNDMNRQAQQLNERHAEEIKSLRDDHKNDMDDQAHQLRKEGAQKQQLRDKLHIVQEKLRKAEDHLARAFVPIEIRALPLPASDDTDLGNHAGGLRNSDHEKVHPTEPVDCVVRGKKPTRRRTNAQVQASKRRQQQGHNADGEREATSKAVTARTYDPTGDDQQTPREEEQKSALPESSPHPNESDQAQASNVAAPLSTTAPRASTPTLPPSPVDTCIPGFNGAPSRDPSDLSFSRNSVLTPPSDCSMGQALHPSEPRQSSPSTEVEAEPMEKKQVSATQDPPRSESCEPVPQIETEGETPQTEPGNYTQPEEKKGKNHNKNVRKRQNDRAKKEAEKAEKARLEAETSIANTELENADSHLADGSDSAMALSKNVLHPDDSGHAQTESTSTPASASVPDISADPTSPSTDASSFNPSHDSSLSVPLTASPSHLPSSARAESSLSTEEEENNDDDVGASNSTANDEEKENHAKGASKRKLRRRRTNNPETKAAQNRRKLEKRMEKKGKGGREKAQDGAEEAITAHKQSDEQPAPSAAEHNLTEDDAPTVAGSSTPESLASGPPPGLSNSGVDQVSHSTAPAEGSGSRTSRASSPMDCTPAQQPHSSESDEDTAHPEQAPTSIDVNEPVSATDQAPSTSGPVEERSGLDVAGSVAESQVSPKSASSQEQQTSGEALPSSAQSPPPSPSNTNSDGVQGIHREGFGQKDHKSPSQNWISYAEWKKLEEEKEEKEQAENKSADSASTPASRTPAAGHQQGSSQPLTSRDRRNGGQPTEGPNQQAPRGMRSAGNDPGAAFRREFYRHVGLLEDGRSALSGPPPEPFVQPQAPKSGKNKGRGQGARQRRKRENDQGVGKSGAY